MLSSLSFGRNSSRWFALLCGCLGVALVGCGRSGKSSGDAGSASNHDAGKDVRLPPKLNPGATVMTAVLPSPRHEPAVFSDGDSVFVAGGLDDKSTLLAEIVCFNPSTGVVAVLPEVLPTAMYAAGVAWTESAAYIFGGLGKGGALRQIVRYVPSEGSATVMNALLPLAAYNVGVVWADSVIYIVGGMAGVHQPQILRYDPTSDTLTTMDAKLPIGVEEPAVFWDGSWVWILGGKADAAGTSGVASNAIQVFDPMTGEATLVGTLPYALWGAPAFTDGDVYYLPGGSATTYNGYTSILKYDPFEETSTTLDIALPVHAGGGSTGTWVWSMMAGYLCGGADTQTGKLSDKIIQVVP